MSEDLFYNRDRNIYGITAPENFSNLSFTPVYGSRVEYTSRILSYETDDSYINMIPASLNNLSVSYKVRYDVNEDDCAKLINFFESKEGYQSFVFNPDNSGIYKSNQSFCENYAVNYINNNHYEFAVDISVDQAPSFFNWRSSYFLNFDSQTLQNPFNSIIVKWKDYNTGWSNFRIWATGNSYKKYDILYNDINTNKLNNFFYCSGDHVSSESNSPSTIGLNNINYLNDSLNFSTDNWATGSSLGNFFTTSSSTIITPNGDLTATKFTSTATTSQGLFLRALQSESSNKYILNMYLYIPTQSEITNWGLNLDAADSIDGGNSVTQTIFDQWVKVSVPIEYTATRPFLDFNIRINGGAPTSSDFVVHAWYPSLNLNVNSMWTQEFFFSPDIGFQNDVKIQVTKLEFKNSFPLRIKTKNNTAKFDINYKFTNIDDRQLLCMLHFLENKAGYRKFRHQIPAVYNRPKVYHCPQWTHTWKYKNHHDLDVTFIEDPLGIIQTDT